jgi:aldose 1-epimerase
MPRSPRSAGRGHPPEPPSGRQVIIRSGDVQATVTEVGASLRELRTAGRDVLYGYPEDSICPGARGQVLMPWPNRLEDGEYEFDGARASAALDEPGARNAIHGLARWLRWSLSSTGPDSVLAQCELPAQPGYPFAVQLSIAYRVQPGGIVVEASALNVSGRRVPFGAGFHPYIAVGPGGVDACRLTVPAKTRLIADERGIPRSREPVAGSPYDFQASRLVGEQALDDCFCDLGDGTWTVVLERADGASTKVWADESFGYVMCYSGDTLEQRDRRKALAVEPMSCPPNAFRSGEALVVLAPGERWSGRWGIGLA